MSGNMGFRIFVATAGCGGRFKSAQHRLPFRLTGGSALPDFRYRQERVYEEFRAVQEDASSLDDALNRHWDSLAAPEHRRMERLLYEMFGISINNPERFSGYARRIANEWLKHISDMLQRFGIKNEPGQELATLIMTVFHGVTLDLAATDDVVRIEKSVRICISQVKLLTNS